MPFIRVGGSVIEGNQAVLRYLAATHAPVWYPEAAGPRSLVDQHLERLQSLLKHLDMVVGFTAVDPLVSSHGHEWEVRYPVLSWHFRQLLRGLASMNAALGKRRWLASEEQPSVADLMGACGLCALNMLKGLDMRWVEAGLCRVMLWCVFHISV